MSSFLTFSGVCASTPDRKDLFQNLTLSIGAQRVGVVGRNGAGKSTLLRIAAGEVKPSAGTITRNGSWGMLVQHASVDASVAEVFGVARGMARINRILAGDGTPEDFAAADWDLPARIDARLADVGLGGLALDRRIEDLSGGERTRLGLARLVLEKPDLLLLDEPTNNLDADGRAAVLALVENWRGGILVASHDRALLETMDRIVELTPVGVHIVSGGWSAFAEQRESERVRAIEERERSDAALRATARTVQAAREAKARRDSAGHKLAATGSQPRIILGAQAERAQNSGGQASKLGERQIEAATARSQAARRTIEVLTPLAISLPPSGLPATAQVLAIKDAKVHVGGLGLGPWSLTIRGPERVAVRGPNGSGKTTLLKVATGAFALSGGTAWRVAGRVAMLDQHVALLRFTDSIAGNLRRLHPELDERAARAACARYAFRNRDADRFVGTLSGGERLRAGLAAAMSGTAAPWLLILDEPTNHLDLASIEVLEEALRTYDGALLVVSHDERFLSAIGIEREYRLPGR